MRSTVIIQKKKHSFALRIGLYLQHIISAIISFQVFCIFHYACNCTCRVNSSIDGLLINNCICF